MLVAASPHTCRPIVWTAHLNDVDHLIGGRAVGAGHDLGRPGFAAREAVAHLGLAQRIPACDHGDRHADDDRDDQQDGRRRGQVKNPGLGPGWFGWPECWPPGGGNWLDIVDPFVTVG